MSCDGAEVFGELSAPAPRRALVVFSGDVDLKWLRVLRPGYRHCFVVVHSGDAWVLYNPLSNGTELNVWPVQPEQCIRDWLLCQGYKVVEVSVRPFVPKALGWAPFSCVEAVKRVLGLRAAWVFTPWQLHQYLEKQLFGIKSLTVRDV
ncbi:MAG: hypothetical protein JKY27_03665 [Magnetovibrio sp.]|nr:hypothetical protein [Magnetovibrio sp.]